MNTCKMAPDRERSNLAKSPWKDSCSGMLRSNDMKVRGSGHLLRLEVHIVIKANFIIVSKRLTDFSLTTWISE